MLHRDDNEKEGWAESCYWHSLETHNQLRVNPVISTSVSATYRL